jgi:DtxR family transcriptional regulator, Mn-dependent transcriptional regulator
VAERPSPAVQDYLKTIYALASEPAAPPVTTSRVAEALAVTSASASNMLKRLDQLGYIDQQRRGEATLTETGRTAALRVLRHHRLLETYLATRLGVPWDEVHREAEILEHHLSEELEARIAEVLGHPERDPHGDPIPSAAGLVVEIPSQRLCDLPVGSRGVVSRVSDRDPDLLRFLGESGLVPDAAVEVLAEAPFGGPQTVRVGGATDVEVPPGAAGAVYVA